jgi:hypothetical protein
MLTRLGSCALISWILVIPLVVAAAEPARSDSWTKLASFYQAHPANDVTVVNGRELKVEGVRCRLLGIRLRSDEDSQRDAKRFLTRYIDRQNRVLQVCNVYQPAEDTDHVPLIWLDGGWYGTPAQLALVQAGLATPDDTGVKNLVLYHDGETRKFEFDWKGELRGAEADFKAGKAVSFGFPWPSPVQADDVVLAALQSRLGKCNSVTKISGHFYLDYRLGDGPSLTLVVYQGRVIDATLDGQLGPHGSLQSAIEARLGKPQGVMRSAQRLYLDYDLDGGKTLTLMISGRNVLGASYTNIGDLSSLVGLEVTVEGKVRGPAKPAELCLATHCGGIYVTGKPVRNEEGNAFPNGTWLSVRGVLKYRPPYQGPLPWPPVQLPPPQYYFETGPSTHVEVSGG